MTISWNALINSLVMATLVSGCSGYTLKGTKSQALELEGIKNVYVLPLKNDTYEAGVEDTVYNSLIKSLKAGKEVKLVHSPKDADAVIFGRVTQAEYESAGTNRASKIEPEGKGDENTSVAISYNARLTCTFSLVKINHEFAKSENLPISENSLEWFDLPEWRNLKPHPFENPENQGPKGQWVKVKKSDLEEDKYQIVESHQKFNSPFQILWSAGFTRSKKFNANNRLLVLGTTSSLINESEFERKLVELSESMMSDVYAALITRF